MAEIRTTGEDGELVARQVVKTINDLDAFLMRHNLIRDFKDLRDDLKWDCCAYFTREKGT